MAQQHLVRGLGALGLVALLAVGWLRRPDDGPVLATATLHPGAFDLSVAERAGRIFVGPGRDGRLTMLDLGSGALLRTIALDTSQGWPWPPFSTAAAVDEGAGRIFVAVRSAN